MVQSAEGRKSRLSTDAFKLYSKSEYFRDVTSHAKAAGKGDRISLTAMSFKPQDPMIAELIDALCVAASQGADVLLITDAYNFLVTISKTSTTPGPLLFRRELSEVVHSSHPIMQAFRRLEAAGGRTAITNFPKQPFTNPFAGRSHIKLTLINDRVYIGGCNLDAHEEIDIMTGWDDAKTAAWLHEVTERTYQTRNTFAVFNHQDIGQPVDDCSQILVDAGKPQQSIIYHQALHMIDEAKESIYITCQYFPNHVTANHLHAAHKRGVKITIVYNHPGKDTWPFNLVHRGVVRYERLRLPHSFFEHELPKGTPFLHAKVLATESSAMVGSHNYVRAGVNWGTAEIALLRNDPKFAKALIAKTELAIKQTSSR